MRHATADELALINERLAAWAAAPGCPNCSGPLINVGTVDGRGLWSCPRCRSAFAEDGP